MSAASQDPILESLQCLQPKLDAFNNYLPEFRTENSNKPEILALCNDLQDYYSKRHKDLLSRYEILKPKEKNQNAVKEVPKIEPKVKEPGKGDEEKNEAKKGEDNFGGYWIPKVLPVTVPKKMLAFCRGYGQGLLKYLITHKKEYDTLRRQLPAALATVNNGASTVLRAMKDYDFSKRDTSLNDSKKTINKKMCISMLECLFPVLGSDENAPVVKYVQDMARNMAKAWREKMGLEKSLEGASKLDLHAFLQLLATFRIGKDFEQDELCEMLLQIVSLKESPALALFLGLSPKMPDFVDKLSKSGEWIEAIRYAHAFGVMDKIKLADLLKAYLEDTEKAIEDMAKKGGKSSSYLLNSTTKEITAINSVINVVKDYNLEDMFPLAGLQNKLESLQKELERLQKVKEMGMGTGEQNLSNNQRNEANKRASSSTQEKMMVTTLEEKKASASAPEKKMMVTTPEEKKAVDAESVKEDYTIEKDPDLKLNNSRESKGNSSNNNGNKGNKKKGPPTGCYDCGGDHYANRCPSKGTSNQRTRTKASASAPEKKMMVTTPEEKKAANAKSVKEDYTLEKEPYLKGNNGRDLKGNSSNNNGNKGNKKKGPPAGCFICGGDHYVNRCPSKGTSNQKMHPPLPPHQTVFQQRIHAALVNRQVEQQQGPTETLDFVDKLSNSGEWIEAIRYAHAFGVMDKIKPADLLKAYLEDTEKAIEDMVKKGGKNPSYLLNSTTKEITAINLVIKVVKEYNLEDMFPLAGLQNKLESSQKELERLQNVKEMRMGTGEHNLFTNQRNEVNKKAASSTGEKMMVTRLEEKKASASVPEKKMTVTTPEEKKAADAKSDKGIFSVGKERLKRPRSSDSIRGNAELFETQGPADLGLYRLSQRVKYASEKEMHGTTDARSHKQDYAIEKERLKRPSSSELIRGNAELFETHGPADLGLYRLSQRVKYASEREMSSASGDKEVVPHNAGLFQNIHGIYRDDHNLLSYHGDSGSALWPSMYGSGNPGTFVTPPPTVTQINERRGSDGYPSASGYSNINLVGSSFYESAQINIEGRGLHSYTSTFGGVDRSSGGSSPYDIDAVANASVNPLKHGYGSGGEANISILGGDNLSNIRSSMYGSNWSSDPNNSNGRRGLDQYMLNLGAADTRSSNSSAYDLGASVVPSSNVYGPGPAQQNSGFASTTSNYGSVASATGVSGQSTINRYQFNSNLRF